MTTSLPEGLAMNASAVHAIALGILDPATRSQTDHAAGRQPDADAAAVAGPGVASRVRRAFGGRPQFRLVREPGSAAASEPWLAGVVPPFRGYPASR
jgi:hypothetical protein